LTGTPGHARARVYFLDGEAAKIVDLNRNANGTLVNYTATDTSMGQYTFGQATTNIVPGWYTYTEVGDTIRLGLLWNHASSTSLPLGTGSTLTTTANNNNVAYQRDTTNAAATTGIGDTVSLIARSNTVMTTVNRGSVTTRTGFANFPVTTNPYEATGTSLQILVTFTAARANADTTSFISNIFLLYMTPQPVVGNRIILRNRDVTDADGDWYTIVNSEGAGRMVIDEIVGGFATNAVYDISTVDRDVIASRTSFTHTATVSSIDPGSFIRIEGDTTNSYLFASEFLLHDARTGAANTGQIAIGNRVNFIFEEIDVGGFPLFRITAIVIVG
jgi:hypothetical protein